MRRIVSLARSMTFAIAVAGCGGGGTASPTAAPGTAAPAAGGSAVTIADFSFTPAALSVKAGTEVIWTNNGDATHSVKWPDATPESAKLTHGQTYPRKFDAAGTFPYVCGIHSSMTGTITVTQ
jgi:plastocyanin